MRRTALKTGPPGGLQGNQGWRRLIKNCTLCLGCPIIQTKVSEMPLQRKIKKKNCCFSFLCLYWALSHTPGDQNDQKSEPRDVFFNQGLNPSLNSSPYWRLKPGPPTCCTSTNLQPSFNPLKLWPLQSLSPLRVPISKGAGSKGETTSTVSCCS